MTNVNEIKSTYETSSTFSFSFSSSLLFQCKISQELRTKPYDAEHDNFRGKNLIGHKSKNKYIS